MPPEKSGQIVPNYFPARPRKINDFRRPDQDVCMHNHPSGDPTPSRADDALTRRIHEGANLMQIRFLDHVVVGEPAPGRDAHFSFRAAGLVG